MLFHKETNEKRKKLIKRLNNDSKRVVGKITQLINFFPLTACCILQVGLDRASIECLDECSPVQLSNRISWKDILMRRIDWQLLSVISLMLPGLVLSP